MISVNYVIGLTRPSALEACALPIQLPLLVYIYIYIYMSNAVHYVFWTNYYYTLRILSVDDALYIALASCEGAQVKGSIPGRVKPHNDFNN